jgi:hypothetical protein
MLTIKNQVLKTPEKQNQVIKTRVLKVKVDALNSDIL